MNHGGITEIKGEASFVQFIDGINRYVQISLHLVVIWCYFSSSLTDSIHAGSEILKDEFKSHLET